MVINPDETSDVEVSFVALVDRPAIEKNFLTFGSHKLDFALDAEQRIISGPAMVADTLIYRKDEQGEYNVFFSKETIKQIALKFFKKDYHKNLNLFHDPTLSLEGVTIFESFVSDKARGVPPMEGFKDLPDGSWFISAKIDNEDVWNKIKSGEVKGFSVEGIFAYSKKQKSAEERMMELLSATYNANGHISETDLMDSVKDLIAGFKKKFFDAPAAPADPAPPAAPGTEKLASDYSLKDGTAVSISELVVGGTVLVNGAPAAPGDYELQDGTKVTCGEGGVISAVTPGEVPAPTDYSDQFAELTEKITSHEQKFTQYEQMFAEMKEANAKLTETTNRANETIVKLFEIVEKMAAAPTADPVGSTGSFSSEKAKSKEERRKELANLLHKVKNN